MRDVVLYHLLSLDGVALDDNGLTDVKRSPLGTLFLTYRRTGQS